MALTELKIKKKTSVVYLIRDVLFDENFLYSRVCDWSNNNIKEFYDSAYIFPESSCISLKIC